MFNAAIGLAIMTGGKIRGGDHYRIPDSETASDRKTALEQALIDFHNHRISGAWASSEFVPFHWANCYRRYITMIYQQEWGLDVEPILRELQSREALGNPVGEWSIPSPQEDNDA